MKKLYIDQMQKTTFGQILSKPIQRLQIFMSFMLTLVTTLSCFFSFQTVKCVFLARVFKHDISLHDFMLIQRHLLHSQLRNGQKYEQQYI